MPHPMSEALFQAVLDALQPAEELGGLEGVEYIALMERVATEARQRADAARRAYEPEGADEGADTRKGLYEIAVYARPLINTTVIVEADDEADAKEKAYEHVSDDAAAFEWSDMDFDRDDIQGPDECEVVRGPDAIDPGELAEEV